jgi:hypothetical protein
LTDLVLHLNTYLVIDPHNPSTTACFDDDNDDNDNDDNDDDNVSQHIRLLFI